MHFFSKIFCDLDFWTMTLNSQPVCGPAVRNNCAMFALKSFVDSGATTFTRFLSVTMHWLKGQDLWINDLLSIIRFICTLYLWPVSLKYLHSRDIKVNGQTDALSHIRTRTDGRTDKRTTRKHNAYITYGGRRYKRYDNSKAYKAFDSARMA